jgi:hypothetical protein
LKNGRQVGHGSNVKNLGVTLKAPVQVEENPEGINYRNA